MAFGKPAISTPNKIDLRPVQGAILAARQRIEALEAAVAVLQNNPGNAAAISALQAEIAGLTLTGSGTVTSVSATVPSFMGIAGTPVTGIGTLAFSFNAQPPGMVLAGPVSGADAAPDFRMLQWDWDLPLFSSVSSLSGLDGHELILVERYGAFHWVTASQVAATAGTTGSGGGTKTYGVFTPMTSQPPASNYATLDTRNSIAILDFDDSTSESAFWVGVIPEGAVLTSGLIFNIKWAATTATSGNVVWGVKIEAMATDMDADSYDTAATVTTACSGTSGTPVNSSITITTIDSLVAGEMYRFSVYRDAASGSDSMAGDAELVAVEVRSAA